MSLHNYNPHTVVNNLTDVFYLCVLMMAYGPVFVRATIHGIIMNMVQSLGSLPEVMSNGKEDGKAGWGQHSLV